MKTAEIFELIGLIGGLIGYAGYVPQIFHLYRKKDSAGLSAKAWYIWGLSSILLLAYAIYIVNRLYIFLGILGLAFNIITIFLIYKYERKKNERIRQNQGI